MTIESLAREVGEATSVKIGDTIQLDSLNQVIAFHPADQLVEVQSGILLRDLNAYLRTSGFEIPFGCAENELTQSVADLLAFNYPHSISHLVGSWRDWVVRMTIILASGEVVKSGANVVKNVSGFDLHKLIIGSRYSLGIPVEVTLRIRPSAGTAFLDKAQPAPDVETIPETERRLMKRTKEIFDPTNKLNAGAFGFI